MRNPDRLDKVYTIALKVHKQAFPDWRFGQFYSNFLSWCVSTGRCSDIFFPEDNKWGRWLIEYANEYSPYAHFEEE